MLSVQKKICLVVPCYNEVDRLDLQQFYEALDQAYFIFVNDGSNDDTLAFLEANKKEGMYILDLKRNVGKAEAVRRGMRLIELLPIYDLVEWIGFVDADLATPLSEITNFLQYNDTFAYNADAIWGSRVKRLGSTIRRLPSRHIVGRAFATLIGFLLKTDFYDSQCGAKLFRKELIGHLFNEPFISRWIFDVELFMRLGRYRAIEYPLKEWHDIRGGKINIVRMLPWVLYDIIRIKWRYRSRR
jgi:glycosyltransferase involved in cell wall biosynthesis